MIVLIFPENKLHRFLDFYKTINKKPSTLAIQFLNIIKNY